MAETNTGTRVQITTDATGQYTALFLLPGDYDITAAVEGFKEYLRKGVHLGAGEHPVINPKLEIGNASESVSVTADAPLVLASLAIGVLATGQPSLIHPFNSGAAAGLEHRRNALSD